MFAQEADAPALAAPQRDHLRILDFNTLARLAGHGGELLAPRLAADSPLFAGHFSCERLREGLQLHCTNITHLHDMHSRTTLDGECIKILVKLEGNARVRIGHAQLPLDCGQGADARPSGLVIPLTRNELFERTGLAGVHERMLVLTLTQSWFDAAGIARHAFGDHLRLHAWQPSARAVAITEQLVRPNSFDGPMHRLYRESRALELIAEALAAVSPAQQKSAPDLPPTAYQRICQLQRLLDSGHADSLEMSAIAQQLGCNANTLQQHFRQVFDCSIFDYLRRSRLERAATALQRDGVSVARAAEIAGYSSQANFSTAFRKHFGQPPKHFRSRL